MLNEYFVGNLKSLRLFFNDSEDSGQLVITSRRNQFRILYFHCGGLQKLSNVLQQWNIFVSAQIDNMDGQLYKHFKICQYDTSKSDISLQYLWDFILFHFITHKFLLFVDHKSRFQNYTRRKKRFYQFQKTSGLICLMKMGKSKMTYY